MGWVGWERIAGLVQIVLESRRIGLSTLSGIRFKGQPLGAKRMAALLTPTSE